MKGAKKTEKIKKMSEPDKREYIAPETSTKFFISSKNAKDVCDNLSKLQDEEEKANNVVKEFIKKSGGSGKVDSYKSVFSDGFINDVKNKMSNLCSHFEFFDVAVAVVNYYKDVVKEKDEVIGFLNDEVSILKKREKLLLEKCNKSEKLIWEVIDIEKFRGKII